MQRKKANIAPRCFWGWLLRTWHEDFLSSFEKQQQKELFPASHTWRKSRHKTHTHTRNSCVLSNSCHWGCAFSLIPVVVILGAFFYSHLNFNRKRIALNGAIDSITPDIIIDETKLFSHQLKLKLVRYGHKANGK
jgi:hypothetical protein